MLVFLFVTIIILSFLAKGFNFGFNGNVDIYKNEGKFLLAISTIPIYSADMYFERTEHGNNSIIIKKGSKRIEIHLNADKKDNRSITRIINYPAFDNVLIKELAINVEVGKKDDAFFTTMILSTLRLVFYSALSFIKTRFNTEVNERFDPQYNSDKLVASFSGIISISFADIISSYIISKFRKNQRLQEVNQN